MKSGGKRKKPKRADAPKSGTGAKRASFGKNTTARHKSTTLAFGEATFDDAKRKEWVTGYRKRKTARRKQAAHDAETRARKERVQARKERREAEKVALGLVDDATGDEEGEEAGEGRAAEEKTDTFASGVVVTVVEGFGDEE
jgi:hypothetical protein